MLSLQDVWLSFSYILINILYFIYYFINFYIIIRIGQNNMPHQEWQNKFKDLFSESDNFCIGFRNELTKFLDYELRFP